MKTTALLIAKRLMKTSPFVHTLIVVGVFISLSTNLLVSFYTATPKEWPLRMLGSALLMLVSAWLYLPVVSTSDRVFREASALGHNFDGALVQLIDRPSEVKVLEMVFLRLLASIVIFAIAIGLLFCWR
ncbi:MAG: hypothetical protein M3461_15140 [Pseudomonadota bacterium]|nr:hypothetical protein [Pseudomonadota bacterium]